MTPKALIPLSCLSAILLLSSTASAQPEPTKAPAVSTELTEKLETKLSKHKIQIAKSTARLKRNLDKQTADANGDVSDELEAVANLLEEVFASDGVFRDLTAMFSDFAEDVEVETDGGKTMLRFDGTHVGEIETRKSRNSEDGISISGLGKSLTLDRETVVKDGKSKTRIVIEMDGEDALELIVPEFPELDQE